MRLIVLIVTVLQVFTSSIAQAPTEAYTWINAGITFEYPADWVVRDDTVSYEAISIATTEAMLDADEIPEGEALFLVNAPISLSPEALAVYDITEEITIADVFTLLGSNGTNTVQVFSLAGRPVARLEYTENNRMVIFLLVQGDEVAYFIYGAFNAVDQSFFEPYLLELANSVQPATLPTDGGSIIEQNIAPQNPAGVVWQQQQPFDDSAFESSQTSFGRLAIGDDDTIYVATGNNSILVISPDGELLRIIHNDNAAINDLALDTDGTFWVTDQYQNKVYHLSAEGDILSGFGEFGSAPDQFGAISPLAIELAPNDLLYLFVTYVISGSTYDEIQIWTKDGELVENIYIQSRGDSGFQDSSFLALGSDELLYAYAYSDVLVQQYALNGDLLQTVYQPGEPLSPSSITVDDSGRIYFATTGLIRIYENGERIQTIGEPALNATGEIAIGTYVAPRGMGFLSNGDLIVVDANESHWNITRIQAP